MLLQYIQIMWEMAIKEGPHIRMRNFEFCKILTGLISSINMGLYDPWQCRERTP